MYYFMCVFPNESKTDQLVDTELSTCQEERLFISPKAEFELHQTTSAINA